MIERIAKHRVRGRHGPCKLAARTRRKCDVEIEIDIAGDRSVVRWDDRIVDSAFGHLRDQCFRSGHIDRRPNRFRMRIANGGKLRVKTGTGRISDRRIDEIGKALGLVTVDVVDEHRLDGVNAGGPQHTQRNVAILRCVLSRCGETFLRGRCLKEATHADVGLARNDFGEQFGGASHGDDP